MQWCVFEKALQNTKKQKDNLYLVSQIEVIEVFRHHVY